MSKKHDVLAEICKNLDIPLNQSWLSSGSTITRESLEAILLHVQKENEFDIETNPLSSELRSIFIKFVRGFEDHYRALKSKEVLIKTKILRNGKIGINIESLSKKIVKDIKISDFAQWLHFYATGDPGKIDCYNDLSFEEQALLMVIRNQHLNSIIQNRLIGILNGDIKNAVHSSGLLPKETSIFNINTTAPVNFHTNIKTSTKIDVDIDIDLGNQIIGALKNNDNPKLRSFLQTAVYEDKKEPGYIKKILTFGKKTGEKLIIVELIAWLNNPENVKSWPGVLVTYLLKALEQ